MSEKDKAKETEMGNTLIILDEILDRSQSPIAQQHMIAQDNEYMELVLYMMMLAQSSRSHYEIIGHFYKGKSRQQKWN